VAGLAKLVAAAAGAESAPPLRPLPPGAEPVASFAQQRLWFLEQWQPGSSRYAIPVALNLDGPLDVAALADTLTRIVRRHHALRTGFVLRGGQPVPVVCPPTPVELAPFDVSASADPDREADSVLADGARLPF